MAQHSQRRNDFTHAVIAAEQHDGHIGVCGGIRNTAASRHISESFNLVQPSSSQCQCSSKILLGLVRHDLQHS